MGDLAADQSPAVIVAEMWDFNVNLFGIASLLMTTIWLVTSLVLLIRLGRAWRSLAKLRRTAHPVDIEIESECRQLANQLKVAAPAVLRSPYLPSPCLAGIRRPVVLLSEQENGLSIRDVLVHELAHLRRHDCHWNLLRRLATALLCFQPLLWWLSRAIETTAEEVCDDHVVQFGVDRTEYANRLVNVAELSSIPAAPAGVGIVSIRSMLARRVERIMDTSRALSTRIGNLTAKPGLPPPVGSTHHGRSYPVRGAAPAHLAPGRHSHRMIRSRVPPPAASRFQRQAWQ